MHCEASAYVGASAYGGASANDGASCDADCELIDGSYESRFRRFTACKYDNDETAGVQSLVMMAREYAFEYYDNIAYGGDDDDLNRILQVVRNDAPALVYSAFADEVAVNSQLEYFIVCGFWGENKTAARAARTTFMRQYNERVRAAGIGHTEYAALLVRMRDAIGVPSADTHTNAETACNDYFAYYCAHWYALITVECEYLLRQPHSIGKLVALFIAAMLHEDIAEYLEPQVIEHGNTIASAVSSDEYAAWRAGFAVGLW